MGSPLLTRDAPSLSFFLGAPQWGIFKQGGGEPILAVNAVESIEYARDYQISDYPQEKGAFQSYNKVQTPFHAKIGFLIADTRRAFLNSVEQAVASLDMVTVVTPDVFYPSANLTHYGYRRTSRNGKTLILVEVWCEEVRVISGSPLFPSETQGKADGGTSSEPGGTQSPNGGSSSQSGQVQAVPATPNGGVNYATGLGSQSGASTSTSLQSVDTSPAFFTKDNLPQVPNGWAGLTGAQQNTVTSLSPTLGVPSTTVIQGGGVGENISGNPSVVIESIEVTGNVPGF